MDRSAIDERLEKYTQLIPLLLDDLQGMFDGDPIQAGDIRWSLTVMDKVAEYLQDQFRLEEQDGYLTEVLEEYPNWYPQVQRLQREHRSLYRQFTSLRDELAAATPNMAMAAELTQRFREWAAAYRKHQDQEASLILDAITLEVGVGE
jgi:hemerythrin